MANVKISGLTAAGAVAGANEFEINEAGTSKKVTGAQIAAHVLGGSYGATLTSLTVDTDVLHVDATNNRVGIGNTTPTEVVDVTGTAKASTFKLTNWTITESAGVLYFATGGTNKAKLDASGNFTVVGNITAYGTM